MSFLVSNTPSWDDLKERVYNQDGSLRDIYILKTAANDWVKWIDFVNENYNLVWTAEEHNAEASAKSVDRDFITKRWNTDALSTCASIYFGSVQINCFFFTETEIENDIDPREIQSMADHQAVVNYMIALSKLLDKKVLLTAENDENAVLIKVYGEEVQFTKERLYY